MLFRPFPAILVSFPAIPYRHSRVSGNPEMPDW